MQIKNNFVLDNDGRTLILRGVNLGGDSKIPFCPAGAETNPSFLDRKNKVSFTGRPFPLEEAHDHFKRLKNAGLTFIRLVVTWEAIEHEGPGIYDEEYLAYLRKIILAAGNEGLNLFIDPHQDVWSRWTGGDGAPAWTMEKLGMDMDMMDRSGSAITFQRYSLYHDGKPCPKMIWPSNYNRYAAATMFSLFFGGKIYAPDLQIDSENIQDWLQNHFIAAFRHAQRRLKNCAGIAGWGTFNEPHNGFIGQQNLALAEDFVIPAGPRPTPWQTICTASGHPVKIPVYNLISIGKKSASYETFNSDGVSLFKEGFQCPWKQAGVWQDTDGAPKLLKPDHFSRYQDRRPAFTDDFLKPFLIKYINVMKEADERCFFFIEGVSGSTKAESHPSWGKEDPPNVINAFHWYDGVSLFTKTFRSWLTIAPENSKIIIGAKNVAAYFVASLAKVIGFTKHKMNNMPSLLGEFGLAFDINKGKSFKTGNYSLHEKALSMYYDAVDANLLHSTIWNYSAGNTNKYGDNWNGEDLSIFSEGKERAGAGWKRPYPMATAGKPLFIKWDRKRKEFIFRFEADREIKSPSIIYLPVEAGCTADALKVEISASKKQSLRWEYKSEEQKLLVFNDDYSGESVINVRLK